MIARKSTIRDVSQLAGVSISTVSRVLNNREKARTIPAEVRKRVLVCAEQLNYVPNANARRVFTHRAGIIGLLVPSHTRMNIYFRELGNESPLLVKLIMQSIYKENDREIRHLGSKRFGIQFLIKGIYTYNGMLYVHTQTKNSSAVPFDTDFIRFKIVDKKVPKRTAIQETVLDAVRSYNEVIEIAGKSTVRTVYALPKFTIPDDKLLLVELYEKNGGRHQSIRVENADIVNANEIDELKIK